MKLILAITITLAVSPAFAVPLNCHSYGRNGSWTHCEGPNGYESDEQEMWNGNKFGDDNRGNGWMTMPDGHTYFDNGDGW